MTILLQLVDSDDNVLFDFNDQAGAVNAGGLRTFCFELDLGAPTGTPVFFDPDSYPGGLLVGQRDELVGMSWKQGFSHAASVDAFRSAVGDMAEAMKEGGILKYRPMAGAEIRYIDFVSAQVGAQLRGQPIGPVKLFSQLHDPDGLPIAVMRQPYLRGVEVSTVAMSFSNDPSGYERYILDDFARVNATGWGTAPRGGAWTVTQGTSANVSVSQGGLHAHTAASQTRETIIGSVQNFDGYFSYSHQRDADGERFIVFRRQDANNYYAVRLVTPVGDTQETIGLIKVVAGVTTQVVAQSAVVADAGSATTIRTVRIQVSGNSIQVKVWRNDAAEPGSWSFTTTDSDISSAGGVGFRTLGLGSGYPRSFTFTAIVLRSLAAVYGGREAALAISTEAPTPVKVAVTGQSDGKTQALLIASRPGDPSTAHRVALSDGTLGTDTTSRASNETSSGTVAQVAYSSAANSHASLRRVRKTVTANLADLRGEWDVFLRVRQNVITGSNRFRSYVQLKWGATTAEPAPFTEAEQTLDSTGYASAQSQFPWVELSMGRILIPEGNITGLGFEIWTRFENDVSSTDAAMELDSLFLVPVATQGWVLIPSIGTTYVSGSSTTGTGTTTDGTTIVLDASGDISSYSLGTPVAGRWRATARYSTQNATGTPAFQIRTGSTTVASADLKIGDNENRVAALEWDADGSTSYSLRMTGPTAGSVHNHEFTYAFIPVLAENQVLRTNPTDIGFLHAEKLDSASNHVVYAQTAGPFPLTLPDGDHILYVAAFDPRRDGVTPQLESSIERSLSVVCTYAPRYRG